MKVSRNLLLKSIHLSVNQSKLTWRTKLTKKFQIWHFSNVLVHAVTFRYLTETTCMFITAWCRDIIMWNTIYFTLKTRTILIRACLLMFNRRMTLLSCAKVCFLFIEGKETYFLFVLSSSKRAWVWKSFYVYAYLFVVLCPTQGYCAHIEKSPMPPKG